MGKLTEEEIEIYFTLKLSNALPDRELNSLNEMMEDDPALKARWEEFCLRYAHEDVDSHFARLHDDRLWEPLAPIERPAPVIEGKRHRPLSILASPKGGIVALLAAAALLAIILLAYKGNYFAPAKPKLAVNGQAQPGKENTRLILPDGRSINLDDERTHFSQYGIQFDRSAGGLLVKAPAAMNGTGQLIVPPGKIFNLRLSDGSDLQINANTIISLPLTFSGGKREIWVNGEAYIDVTKDPGRMFIVHTRNGDIQVLGTAFNVNTYDSNHTRIALVSGAVNIQTAKQKMLLKAGTTATTISNNGIEVHNTNSDTELSWKEGRYFFQNAGITEIKAILERWYGVSIVVNNSASLVDLRFTGGVNKDEDIKIFLDNLSAVTQVTYQVRPGQVILN
ncbi:DUF4974 domain-containing protein [Chitinophaga polysaccharea]|uniref:FecR family protein n=1 Tax=Chitinophaga TaxID=79328 RepID=UPI0014558EBE|nr:MULTISPECIES: FecR domain-containing protein [Chitinophaga]NLR58314.1 DUF4974 domain-containing protein [Chitinophaga polysaccharea]NLU90840.1 DUF4974 domain-containing protein [Chitinophaga sp. Ak27]